jgi:hypothetical protein
MVPPVRPLAASSARRARFFQFRLTNRPAGSDNHREAAFQVAKDGRRPSAGLTSRPTRDLAPGPPGPERPALLRPGPSASA